MIRHGQLICRYTINYIIIIVHAQTRYAGSLWIPDLDLRYRDRAVVKRGKLCDKHICMLPMKC